MASLCQENFGGTPCPNENEKCCDANGTPIEDIVCGITEGTTFCPATTTSAESDGDPHFHSFGDKWYDFMGACDLHLVQAPALNLTIDIRTKIRYDYSFIESAVVDISGEKTQVSSFGQYSLNGVENAELPSTIGGFPIVHTQPNKKTHFFKIDLGQGEDISLKVFKDWVGVKINNAKHHHFAGSKL